MRIKKELEPSNDYIFDKITIDNKRIELIYNEVLADSKSINDFVLLRLIRLDRKKLNNLENNIPSCNILIINEEDIIDYLNNGFLIIIYKKIYACELKSNLDRGVSIVQSELSLGGAKDSFSEIYNTNLGLIRRRIKSKYLKVCNLDIGIYTKTKIGILYIDNICNKKLVNSIENNLNRIDIDGIIDSSYLKYALEGKNNFFPTIIMTERPDKCSMALLEGKVVVIVDNSPYALILPSFFIDFFHTPDDYYQKSFNATFIRIIRLIAFFIAIFTPALYISVTTRNYNLVPLKLLLMLKAGRTFVPFPAYIEALFMIVCFEILKESDIRMSSTSGSAISILGGLILGDAAVAAGIVSPIMIIIIAISSIAGLIFNSIELVNTLRIYKIILLILGTILGIYGVIIGTIILVYNICTTEIFGYHYLLFDKNELKDSFVKIDTNVKYRNSKLTKNVIRGRYK
ncbi:MAG: spore germination protein [Bacilli bacterium]|nr:spore germination protein [Bacilli bacterium]